MPEEQPASTHFSPDGLDLGMATDVGRVREANEDALLVLRGDGLRAGQALVAVADGMGGHKAGEVASALAIESMRRALEEVDPTANADDLLKRGMELGNRTIWEAATADIDKDGMGTTLVCALLSSDGQAVIANVGDSRAYSVIGGQASLVDFPTAAGPVPAGAPPAAFAPSAAAINCSSFWGSFSHCLNSGPSVCAAI